jgi:hypothetical protein
VRRSLFGLDAGVIVMLMCGEGSRGRPRDHSLRVSAALRFDWLLLDRGPLHLLHLTRRRRFGLERLEEPERTPQLGERRAAIAQQRIERPGTVAVADKGLSEIPIAPQMMLKQLSLDALGTLEPPGGAGDAPGEHGLQRALGRQLLDQCRLERGELLRLLVADDHEFLGAKPVLQGVLR